MDFCRNIPLSGGLPSEYQPEQVCSKLGSLDDLFSGHSTEGDVNLEWLSIFVEDCLSSTGNCLPPQISPPNPQKTTAAAAAAAAATNPKPQTHESPLHKFLVPSKARTKRKRKPPSISKNPSTSWSHHFNPHGQTLQITNSDPPLLQQAYWLADSELILPQKAQIFMRNEERENTKDGQEEEEEGEGVNLGQQTRRCSHCLSQRTPQWRAGPLGPKTLCNACGVRYKSGRLLPEYRPAKSPTFVSYKHSNSHKKVLEMRMSSSSSSSSNS